MFKECNQIVGRIQCEKGPYDGFPRPLAGANQSEGDQQKPQPEGFLERGLVELNF